MLKGVLNKGIVKYSLGIVVLALCVISLVLFVKPISGNLSETGFVAGANENAQNLEIMNFQETGISPDDEGTMAPPQPPASLSNGTNTSGTPDSVKKPSTLGFASGGSGGSSGSGNDAQCPTPPKQHRICDYVNNACSLVNGDGTDECSDFDDCVHSECVEWSCAQVNGKGNDSCASDQECTEGCVAPYLEADKTALPNEATCQKTTISLGIEGKGDACGQYYPVDVVIVFDKSGSMDDDGWDGTVSDWQPIGDAKIAAKTFAGLLKTNDKSGLVSFSTTATVDQTLTFDKQAVKNKISGMTAGGWTNMSHALNLANLELLGNGRPEVKWIEVLLSDGNNNCGTNSPPSNCHEKVFAAANDAKNAGIIVYTIALGENSNQTLMHNIADITGGDFYYAPNSSDLQSIYEEIANKVTTMAGIDVFVYDYLPAYVELNQSTLPSVCSYDALQRKITCDMNIININETENIEFDVYVKQLGYQPTNVYPDSGVSYRNHNGTTQFVSFPETRVTVNGYEGAEEICNDTYDNDCDGTVDWNDTDCRYNICDYNTFTCENVPNNVSGDACEENSDCYHMVCSEMACTKVAGEGEDSCAASDECYHMECNYNQSACTPASGEGEDECTIWNDCQFCGNERVEGSEQCEVPDTFDNFYCTQSIAVCSGTKLGTRDANGDCNSECGCNYDDFVYGCSAGQCGAECDNENGCTDTGCEETYNDYCVASKLVEYDGDKVMDSTFVNDTCENSCTGDCACTNCEVDCSPPETQSYCVKGVCGATCAVNSDCADYCDGSVKRTGSVCDSESSCMCGKGTATDCDSLDGWYNTTETNWINSGECQETEQMKLEYREYDCGVAPAVDCYYSVTETKWVDTGAARNKADGTVCNDGAWCTDSDVCTAGVCGGTAKSCNDGIECTDDSCDEENDNCVNVADDTKCNNGLYCDGIETCNAVSGCTGGTAVDCSSNDISEIAACDNVPDSIQFTWDFGAGFESECDEGTDSCTDGSQTLTHTCDVEKCGAECETNAGCEKKCVEDVLYNVGQCQQDCTCSYEKQDCNQNNGWYNTTSTKWEISGECTEREFVLAENRDFVCNLHSNCTNYTVIETKWVITGQTRNKPDQTVCNDGKFCTANDVCTAGVCGGATSTCIDSIDCTIDACDEVNDTCLYLPDNTKCDDGKYCNGVETCRPQVGCAGGTAINCNGNNVSGIAKCNNVPDSNPFTWDYRVAFVSVCNEATDSCTNGNETLSHTCSVEKCGAVCDATHGCANSTCSQSYNDYCSGAKLVEYNSNRIIDSTNVSNSTSNYCLGSCQCTGNTVTCSPPQTNTYCVKGVCNAACDAGSGCADYCQGDMKYTGRSCDASATCSCSTGTSYNCSASDGWKNTSSTQWVNNGECKEKEQKKQEYYDYGCSSSPSVDCTYTVTGTRWVDTGAVRNKNDGTACSDGKFCTTDDVCTAGVCGGTVKTCADTTNCTNDACDEANDVCVNTPDNSKCNDGKYCNGIETCNAVSGCVSGTAVSCSGNNIAGIAKCNNVPDSNPFTWDYRVAFVSVCNEATDSCTTGTSTLTHACSVANCGAQCDSNDDCTCQSDGCVGADWYDYPADNSCSSSCTCGSCTPAVSICDSRCMGECKVSFNVGHDMSPKWENIYTVKNDIYIVATTNGKCNGMTIPVKYLNCKCPNSNPDQEAIEATSSDWEPKYDRLCTADAGDYNNNPTHTLVCGPESMCTEKIHEFKFPQDEGVKFWTQVGSGDGTSQIDIVDYHSCYSTVWTLTNRLALACADSIEDENNIPYGYLDEATCTYAGGWAKDSARENEPIYVHMYFDPGTGQLVKQATANLARSDVGNHGFNYAYPKDVLQKICDGQTHTVKAYGIDYQEPLYGPNQELGESPKTVSSCGYYKENGAKYACCPTAGHTLDSSGNCVLA